MPRAKKTEVAATKSEQAAGAYPVRFADDVFGEGGDELAQVIREAASGGEPRVMLVADANVVQRTPGLGTKVGRFMKDRGFSLAGQAVVMGGGEKIKNDSMTSAQRVIAGALDARIGARDVVLVIGGGTIFDVAGYAAAQVRGGLPVVRIPTTVAAMLDGAFAETGALDSVGVKNALAIPSRPAGVVIDTTFAKTVLDGVWRGGVGEAVRYAAVKDSALFKKIAKNVGALKSRDVDVMAEIVKACVESRMKKGGTDFSLWSAHRLEAMSAYKLPHGYAVPIAICIDCAYAVERGLLDEDDQETVCRVLADSGALDGLSHSQHLLNQPDNILRGLDAWCLANGSEAITVPSGIGKCVEEETPDREVLTKVIKAFHQASTQATTASRGDSGDAQNEKA